MKFFIAISNVEGTLGCFTRMSQAKDAVRASLSDGFVNTVEVPVTPETICKLLGNEGGYATDSKVVEVQA